MDSRNDFADIRLFRLVERIGSDGSKRKHYGHMRPQEDPVDDGILTIHETFDASGKAKPTEGYVEILSETIQTFLRKALEGYPGSCLDSTPLRLQHPYYSLVHRHKEIKSLASRSQFTAQEKRHIQHLLKFIHEQLQEQVRDFESAADLSVDVSFLKLWTIFIPGRIVVQRDGVKFDECYEIRDIQYTPDHQENMENKLFLLKGRQCQFSDGVLGYSRSTEYPLQYFPGTKPVRTLDWTPLEALEDWETFEKEKIKEGHKWWRIISTPSHQHCRYDAVAFTNDKVLFPQRGHPWYGPGPWRVQLYLEELKEFKASYVRGEIVVDQEAFSEVNPDYCAFSAGTIANTKTQMDYVFSDNYALIAPARLPGFALEEKFWGLFLVREIRDIEWSKSDYEQLQIDPNTKMLLRDLVVAHRSKERPDNLPGRGVPLVFLLHGNPGMGKTYTTQALARYIQKPLYATTYGELSKNQALERNLREALRWSQRWGAVFLLDEADIFLAKRDLVGGMKRNETVTIFLQQIEYTSGVIFLSTNRKADFDPAILSRVHLPIPYDGLSQLQRQSIWFSRLQQHFHPSEADLKALANAGSELSGRDVRNIVHMAVQLSRADPEKLNIGLLLRLVSLRQENLSACEEKPKAEVIMNKS